MTAKRCRHRLRRVRNVQEQIDRFNKELGQRIRELRKERGACSIRLGKAIGKSPAQISRLETGVQGVRSSVLLRLARALGVEPRELLPD